MQTYLNHVAINVADFDWYKKFFGEVLGMTSYKARGEAPHRQLWFVEGIQINEALTDEAPVAAFSHFGFLTEDVPALIETVVEAGCSRIEGKDHWFRLPDGVEVEVKKIGTVPEVFHH